MDLDYTKPELYYKGLVYVSDGKIPKELREQRKNLLEMGCMDLDVELCHSCGWKSYNELTSSYCSRVRIFNTRDNIGLWALGPQWLLRDQPNDGTLGNDYTTQQFLRGQPTLTIPLINEMRLLSAPTDQIQLTLMSRVQGESLYHIWKTLTQGQKNSYIEQLAECLKQLRRFSAPTAQKVDGSLPDDVVVGLCQRRHPPACTKMGRTKEEWLDGMSEQLRYGLAKIHRTKSLKLVNQKLQELKDSFPACEPYVLTHGDLNLSNIIVKDDKIEAIIDWEMSAYLPWWAERRISIVYGSDDSDELFYPLWEKLCPELDRDMFYEQVLKPVGLVAEALAACNVDHPDSQSAWLRPAFCTCKPFAGRINLDCLGNKIEHKVRKDCAWEELNGVDEDGVPFPDYEALELERITRVLSIKKK